MPLSMVSDGESFLIKKIMGKEEVRRFLENLGFVVGSDVSKTTYGLVSYDAPLRLYHYHIKSLDDWKHKLARGSAANAEQFYDEDITKNKWYGGYEVPDLSMQHLRQRLGL